MIKIALKHLIYEQCINVLFYRVVKNFVGNNGFEVGENIKKMIFWYKSKYVEFYDVKIISYVNYELIFTYRRKKEYISKITGGVNMYEYKGKGRAQYGMNFVERYEKIK